MPTVDFFRRLRRFSHAIGIPLLEATGLCGVASVLHGDLGLPVTLRERCTNGRPTVDRQYAKSSGTVYRGYAGERFSAGCVT